MAQNVKTFGALAIASVKTVEGLAIASAKTIMGVDNTSGGGFVPTDIAGLQGWWQADSYNSGTGTATDLSGNANDATQGTAGARPGTGTNNGHTTFSFDGGDFLQFSGITLTDFTIFLAVKPTTTFDLRSLIGGTSAGLPAPDIHLSGSGTVDLVHYGTAVIATGTTDIADGTWRIAAVSYSGSTGTIYVNGVSDGTGNQAAVFAAIACIGASGVFTKFLGEMDDVLIYNSSLSGTDRNSVVNYLKTRAGI